MAQLSTKIKSYCEANGVSNVDFTNDVMLQDDSNGQGAYIKEWNLDIAQPTNDQLNSYDTVADLKERQNAVRNTRRNAYASLGDQLDMQYKDALNGTTTWKDHIASVKSANPIPTE